MNQNYSHEQRRQPDFLCEQVKHLEAVLQNTQQGDKTYAQQMRIYLATVKEIRALHSMVSSSEQADALLAFIAKGDAV